MWLVIDLTGQRFGRLIVSSRSGRSTDGHATWHCACDCGAKLVVKGKYLKNGDTRSCGCLARERSAECGKRTKTHGQSGNYGKASAEYMTWARMKNRCYNDKDRAYKWWGARGITVCAEWLDSFEAFYRDMGPRPPGMTIERKKNDLGYSKDNCVWATQKQQQRNRRDTVMNVDLAREAKRVRDSGGNLRAWAVSRGIKAQTAWCAAVGKTWA